MRISANVAIVSDAQAPANVSSGQHLPHSETHGIFPFSSSAIF